MTITLTGQPRSTNHIYRYACRGNHPCMYMTAEGKALKEAYQWEARAQWRGDPLRGPVEIEVTLFHGDKCARDIDNYSKILLDALTGIVWDDDKQVEKMAVVKAYDRLTPRVELSITASI